MSSRKTEDLHTLLLRKLVSDSGLECSRTPVLSVETSSYEEEGEEEEIYEEEEVIPEPEPEAETEEVPVVEEEQHKDGIFPTRSLRKLLPERIRKMEAHNRIDVLPEPFRTDIDPKAIPIIKSTPEKKYIDDLADIVGCHEYKHNLAEYWFLDTLANLLRRAQEAGMDRPAQAKLILWWCEWMKEIQKFDAADRPRMMKRFQDNMQSAARFVALYQRLPTPEEAGVYYKAQQDDHGKSRKNKVFKVEEGSSYECAMQDLVNIMHYIYDVFSTDFQFNLIRSVFTFSPEYKLIDAPNQMQMPKRNYQAPKPKTTTKTEKSPTKKEKDKKPKGMVTPPEEYLYLMALRAREEQELAAKEEVEREQWLRKSSILPLGFAVNDEFFNKYWPPPTPPEIVPEPPQIVAPNKAKGKKK